MGFEFLLDDSKELKKQGQILDWKPPRSKADSVTGNPNTFCLRGGGLRQA